MRSSELEKVRVFVVCTVPYSPNKWTDLCMRAYFAHTSNVFNLKQLETITPKHQSDCLKTGFNDFDQIQLKLSF